MRGISADLWAFLRGVLAESVFWVWFFDGEVVVECVVNVVR
jgi:hypothetical protein